MQTIRGVKKASAQSRDRGEDPYKMTVGECFAKRKRVGIGISMAQSRSQDGEKPEPSMILGLKSVISYFFSLS